MTILVTFESRGFQKTSIHFSDNIFPITLRNNYFLIDQNFLFSSSKKLVNLKNRISSCVSLAQNEITTTYFESLTETKCLTENQEFTV